MISAVMLSRDLYSVYLFNILFFLTAANADTTITATALADAVKPLAQSSPQIELSGY